MDLSIIRKHGVILGIAEEVLGVDWIAQLIYDCT